MAIKYLFKGDVDKACGPVLSAIEQRLSWHPTPSRPLIDRIIRVGDALLTLKELEYGVKSDRGLTLRQRQDNMIDHLLHPLEEEWVGEHSSKGIQTRVKALRMKIFPAMTHTGGIDEPERIRRWRHLAATYLAQQIACYPDNYIVEHPSVDRIIETVEKFEEDLFGRCRVHGHTKVVLDVGESIEVSSKRVRSAESEPLIETIRERLQPMMANLQAESKMYQA